MQEKEQKWYSGMLGVTFNAEEGRITIFRSTLEHEKVIQAGSSRLYSFFCGKRCDRLKTLPGSFC